MSYCSGAVNIERLILVAGSRMALNYNTFTASYTAFYPCLPQNGAVLATCNVTSPQGTQGYSYCTTPLAGTQWYP
jgi:hypothetical protein